ncbi:IS3 family transposase [Solibacillus daqui]|uniref:IS3 family transposase n=1 Tax=Solibacillus daqui TaxID=2912187 RepID=UPI003B75CA91
MLLRGGIRLLRRIRKKIEKYIDYYNNDRIKQKFDGMSPIQYRTHTSRLTAFIKL